MIEPAIVSLALADANTAALLVDRIYPLILPDDCAKPAATYRVVSTIDTYTLDGAFPLLQVRLQIDCWGNSYADAKALAAALYALLNEYAGVVGTTVDIACIMRDAEMTGYDPNERAYYVQTDWMIQYSQL